jgi:hypothetical protein
MSKRLSRDEEAEIRALHASGFSARALARQIGCSHTTVQNVLRAGAAAAPPPSPPGDAEEFPSGAPDDLLDFARQMMRDSQRLASDARGVGNFAAAQKASRDSAAYLVIIARLQKAKGEDGDVVRVPRAAIADMMGTIRARVEAILDRPLLCAHCSRELSIEWGTGKKCGA